MTVRGLMVSAQQADPGRYRVIAVDMVVGLGGERSVKAPLG